MNVSRALLELPWPMDVWIDTPAEVAIQPEDYEYRGEVRYRFVTRQEVDIHVQCTEGIQIDSPTSLTNLSRPTQLIVKWRRKRGQKREFGQSDHIVVIFNAANSARIHNRDDNKWKWGDFTVNDKTTIAYRDTHAKGEDAKCAEAKGEDMQDAGKKKELVAPKDRDMGGVSGKIKKGAITAADKAKSTPDKKKNDVIYPCPVATLQLDGHDHCSKVVLTSVRKLIEHLRDDHRDSDDNPLTLLNLGLMIKCTSSCKPDSTVERHWRDHDVLENGNKCDGLFEVKYPKKSLERPDEKIEHALRLADHESQKLHRRLEMLARTKWELSRHMSINGEDVLVDDFAKIVSPIYTYMHKDEDEMEEMKEGEYTYENNAGTEMEEKKEEKEDYKDID